MIEGAVLEDFGGVVDPFQKYIPEFTKWMDEDKRNDRRYGNARIAKGKEQIGRGACE